MDFLIKGIILGFAIAAPVGPIGVLCIRRTLEYGRWSGLCSGLGAAIADVIYGMIAVLGLGALSDFLISGQFWLQLIGGIFLVYLGGRTFFTKPQEKTAHVTHGSLIKDFISTFLLTLTNPMTILSYLAIFAGLGISQTAGETLDQGGWLILGVFLGSALWWMILSEGVTLFRKKASHRVMLWVNRIAGLVIMGFGLAAFVYAALS
jgi:threonine/homoserine/homoserine lactone efflux protein